MSRQYDINVPLLVIGFSLKLDAGYKAFSSTQALIDYCDVHRLLYNRARFTLYEITPKEAKVVPIKGYKRKTSVGFIAESNATIIEGINFSFVNQYPIATRCEEPPFDKDFWALHSTDNLDWCKIVTCNKIPYRYELLEVALTELAKHIGTKRLIDNIISSVARQFNKHSIFKKEATVKCKKVRYIVLNNQ